MSLQTLLAFIISEFLFVFVKDSRAVYSFLLKLLEFSCLSLTLTFFTTQVLESHIYSAILVIAERGGEGAHSTLSGENKMKI